MTFIQHMDWWSHCSESAIVHGMSKGPEIGLTWRDGCALDKPETLTGFPTLSGNTVSPPSCTSDRYIRKVARRCPPFTVFILSWK